MLLPELNEEQNDTDSKQHYRLDLIMRAERKMRET